MVDSPAAEPDRPAEESQERPRRPGRRVAGGRHRLPTLREPVMVAAFEGWNDAGEAASQALRHLDRSWQGQPLGALDSEDFYDYQVNRPKVRILGPGGSREITWPTTRLTWARPPGSDRDVVMVHGIEPSMRWRGFTDELVGWARRLDVRTVVTLGALLADSPHTRPIPVTSTTEDDELLERLALQRSTYEGPTGIVGVLQDAAARAGLPTISLWASVPHYVGQSPSPKATLALLRRVEEVLDVTVDHGDLPEDARAWERGVDELASDDSEIAEYVSQLERAKDTSELPEASGDAIARDFERYLRRRDDDLH